MYISRRKDGFKQIALVFSMAGMIIILGLCIFLFIRIRALEAGLVEYDKLKKEYTELSQQFIEYTGKSGEYLKELEMRVGMLEDTAVNADETVGEPLPEEDVKEPEAVTTSNQDINDKDVNDTEGKGKKVYLTFDDGPSANTDEILDILNSYGVRATFFVNGKKESLYADYYQRIVNEGHTIAMHSYTHAYSEIYASVDAFMADMVRLRDYIVRLTGVSPDIYRFPGGSSNTITHIDIREFGRALASEGIVYFDWNVSSGDASSVLKTADEIYESVISGVKSKSVPVVLMHDLQSKVTTVEALPRILDYLVNNGYEVVALDGSVKPVQHVKLDK